MDSVSGGAESGNGSLETQWCPEEPEIAWTEGRNVATLGVLAIIDVMVVAGNCLVVAAVFLSHKLRSVTNLFIVSLAVADLLVGVAVLPFSAAWEVFKFQEIQNPMSSEMEPRRIGLQVRNTDRTRNNALL
ncbi:octopamine receptor Oamb-like [Schistocerca americana]|uniref:octopamine receptor Oamb-like n=1 Tax=Schistocerca americana TaxID=7009 RepID=UPI001F4F87D6|nr:octopamine receptor Oamb-like [Schistocerca americana]